MEKINKNLIYYGKQRMSNSYIFFLNKKNRRFSIYFFIIFCSKISEKKIFHFLSHKIQVVNVNNMITFL